MANGFDTMTFVDFGGEVSTLRVKSAEYTAANFDAQAALRGAFESAVVNMTTISPVNAWSYGNEVPGSEGGAASPYAQREMKWQINYLDTDGKMRHFSIGCPKTSLLDPNNKKFARIGDGSTVDNFVAAVEAYILGANGGGVDVKTIELKRGGK